MQLSEKTQELERGQRTIAEKTQAAWERKLQLDKRTEELNQVRDSLENSLRQAQDAQHRVQRLDEDLDSTKRRYKHLAHASIIHCPFSGLSATRAKRRGR